MVTQGDAGQTPTERHGPLESRVERARPDGKGKGCTIMTTPTSCFLVGNSRVFIVYSYSSGGVSISNFSAHGLCIFRVRISCYEHTYRRTKGRHDHCANPHSRQDRTINTQGESAGTRRRRVKHKFFNKGETLSIKRASQGGYPVII